jgi:hypothetical protein
MTETLHPTPAPVPLAPPVNRIGRASLIVGIVLGVLQLGATVVGYLTPLIAYRTAAGIAAVAALNAGIGIVLILIGAVAAILGFIGLSRPGLPRGAAAAGAALGLSAVVHIVFSMLAGPAVAMIGQITPVVAPFDH